MSEIVTKARAFLPFERLAEIKWLLERLPKGQCHSVVGVPDVGVSYFLRTLSLPEVQRFFLKDRAIQFLVSYVDFNRLSERDTELAFYELLVRSVLDAVQLQGFSSMALQDDLAEVYSEILAEKNKIVIPRYFERCMHLLLNEPYENVVMLLDHFETVLPVLPSSTLLNLRSTRDEFRHRLSFVVGTAKKLSQAGNAGECQPFFDLFEPHVFVLKPLTAFDLDRMISNMSEKHGILLEEDTVDFLEEFVGGHPGLLQAAFDVMSSTEFRLEHGVEAALEHLLASRGIAVECDKLWRYLSQEERVVLSLVSRRQPVQQGMEDVLYWLEEFGLVRRRNHELSAFSPLIQRLVISRQETVPSSQLLVDRKYETVILNGKDVTSDLSPSEHRLFFFLYDNADKVCSKQAITKSVWDEDYQGTMDNYRIQKLVERLRTVVEPDPSSPRHIITVRGRGYKLALDSTASVSAEDTLAQV